MTALTGREIPEDSDIVSCGIYESGVGLFEDSGVI